LAETLGSTHLYTTLKRSSLRSRGSPPRDNE
jgi:hypothetical protein